jgi:hypothetical protein
LRSLVGTDATWQDQVSAVKLEALVADPPAVVTLIFPDDTPDGTLTVMEVIESLVTEPFVPLNVTEVAP